MATLIDADERTHEVHAASAVIGRTAPAAQVVIDDPAVSGVHAILRWTGARWEVRDVSRNGTWLDESRLPADQPVALRVGQHLRLGETVLRVADLAPPQPVARCGEAVVVGRNGILSLPDDAEPEVVIRFDDGAWRCDEVHATRPVSSGDAVAVGQQLYVVELPSLEGTVRTTPRTTRDQACYHFHVSRDEEVVEVQVETRQGLQDLGVRAHHYLLLTLARLRSDEETAEPGWVEAAELARMLRIEPNLLYTHVFRVRRDAMAAGLVDGRDVIERAGPRLRFGCASFELHTLD